MAKHLAVYNVYAKDGNIQDTENLILIKEGWSWSAAVFNVFWAAYHGLWWVFGGLLIIQMIFAGIGVPKDLMLQEVLAVIKLGFMGWVGCNAADWRMWSLKRKGYCCVDVVAESSEMAAQYKLLSQYADTTHCHGGIVA